MADPRRLLDDPDALSALECRVLTAGGAATPGELAKKQIWAALSARLPPPGGGPGSGGGPSDLGGPAAGAGTAGAAKATAGLGAAAGASVAGTKGVAGLSIAKAAVLGVSLGVVAVTGASTLTPQSESYAPAPAAHAAGEPARVATPRSKTAGSRQAAGDRGTGAAELERRARAGPLAPVPRAHREPLPPGSPALVGREPEVSTGALAIPAAARAAFPVAPALNQPAPTEAVAAPAAPPATAATAATAAPSASVGRVHEESRIIAGARDALRSAIRAARSRCSSMRARSSRAEPWRRNAKR